MMQPSSEQSSAQLQFGKDFLFGAAAAAYQLEGAAALDGKGPSVWDMFCEKPGAVFGGHSGAHACDHYHRYQEDADLLQGLGVGAYRFSLSWPRLFPEGRGSKNEKGFDFYDRLIDSLLERGVTPWATLFHWDYPLALFHRGGWLNPDSPHWFAEYAAAVTQRFSDRVKHFFTLNEPQVFLGLGHLQAEHAPGLALPLSQVLLAGHHALLAHGRAVQALRAGGSDIAVGYAPACTPKLPTSEAPKAVELARRATFEIFERNTWNNAWWMDPVFLGEYPAQGLSFFGKDAPAYTSEEMALISQPLDFFGVNVYHGVPVVAAENAHGFLPAEPAVGAPETAFNWPVSPEALYYGPKFFAERYGKSIYITENGLTCRDWVALDGKVHDGARIDYLQRYLGQLLRAKNEGVDIAGYFHWSILDNFEWAAGYRERFGLVHVDYQTLKRTPKDSYYFYRDLIAGQNG